MKKILLSRNYFALGAVILLVTSIYVSCKKSVSGDLPQTKSELITEARSYFEDEVVNLPQLNDNNFRHNLNKTPLWDKAVVKRISLGDAVIIPIKYEKDILLKPEDGENSARLERTSYLLIYRDRKENLQAEWVNLMPIKNLGKTNFVGIVNIENWNGEPKRSFAVDNEKHTIPVYLNAFANYKEISYKTPVNCTTYIYYGQNFYTGGQSSVYVIRTETFCTGSFNQEGEEHGSDSSPNPNTEEEAVTDDYITYYMDCNYDIDGTATFNDDCQTCMGGNTGITVCPTKEIKIDTGARKCLDTLSKGIINSASILLAFQKIFTIETNSNSVVGMINRISQSTDWNVVIKEGNITSETNYAGDTIETNATTSANQGKINITFNKSYLNQATNLSVARTMIHELMHSYFTYGIAMPSDPAYGKFIEANELLFKKNGNPYNDQNDAQHEQIANKYVTQMSSLLEAYAISAGIQSPDPSLSLADYCKDLAWGGLKDTKAYRKYATDKTRIDKHLKSEAKNEANSTKKKGC